jgi:hypothetical protein
VPWQKILASLRFGIDQDDTVQTYRKRHHFPSLPP